MSRQSAKPALFSAAIFRENLRRFWFLSLLGFGAYFFSTTYLVATNYSNLAKVGRTVLQALQDFDGFSLHASFLLPLAAACAVFSFAGSNQASNMIHALPLSRTAVFNSTVLAGLVLTLLPLLLNTTILLLLSNDTVYITANEIINEKAYEAGSKIAILTPTNVLIWTWKLACSSFYTYAVAVLAATLTGKIVTHGLLAIAMNFIQPLFAGALITFSGHFLFGYQPYDNYYPLGTVPIVSLLAESNRHYFLIDYYGDLSAGKAVFFTLLALALILLALWLFLRRPEEKVGNSLVFTRLETPLCMLAAMTGMVLVPRIFTANAYGFSGLAVGCLIGVVFGQVFLTKSLRIWTKQTAKRLALSALVCALFVGIFLVDITGYESRLPQTGAITSIQSLHGSVNAYFNNERIVLPYYTLDAPETEENIQAVLDFHQSIVAQKEELKIRRAARNELMFRFNIVYQLDSGKQFSRYYELPYLFVAESSDLKQLFESAQYPQFFQQYWGGPPLGEIAETALYAADLYNVHSWLESLKITNRQEVITLRNALVTDFTQRTFADLVSLKGSPLNVTFQFRGHDPWQNSPEMLARSYSLKPTYTNTLSWLQGRADFNAYFPTEATKPDYAFIQRYEQAGSRGEEIPSLIDYETRKSYILDLTLPGNHLHADPALLEAVLDSDIWSTAKPEEISLLTEQSEIMPVNLDDFYLVTFTHILPDPERPQEEYAVLTYHYIRPEQMPESILRQLN